MPAPRNRLRLGGTVLLATAALVLTALPAFAWTTANHPAPPVGFGPAPVPQVAADGSALLVGADPAGATPKQARLVRRTGVGAWSVGPHFPSGFSTDSSYDTVKITEPDKSGAVLVYSYNNTTRAPQYLHLARGQNPSTATPKAIGFLQHWDANQAGAAAAIIGGGSTISVARRASGASSDFVDMGSLNRLGQQRSYGVGITVDPNGGIFVVYKTEQSASLLQAYAPPGGQFGTPQVVAAMPHNNDYQGLAYVQSTNGNVALGWTTHRTSPVLTSDKLVVATRKPGGLLGAPRTLSTAPSDASDVVVLEALGITDTGEVYAGHRRGQRVSGCPTNIHGISTSYLSRSNGSGWTTVTLPNAGSWKRRTETTGIATGGNHVLIAVRESATIGSRCSTTTTSTNEVSVRRALTGGTRVIAPININAGGGNLPVYPTGIAVGTGGHAVMVVAVPNSGQRAYKVLSDTLGPAPKPSAGSSQAAPSQKLKKGKAAATTRCAAAGASCTATVVVKLRKGSKFRQAGRLTATVGAGKQKVLRVKLDKQARNQLAKASKARKKSKRWVQAKVSVTIVKADSSTHQKTYTIKVRV